MNLLALTDSLSSTTRAQCKKAKTDSGESDSTVLRKRCLRSRTVPFRLVDSKSGLDESPNVSGNRKPKENVEREFGTEELETKKAEEVKDGHGSGDFDVLVEKSLRYRKIPFGVVCNENGNTKLAEDRRPKQKTKTHAPSEEKENAEEITCIFVGEPVPEEEVREKRSWRYELKPNGVTASEGA